MSLFFLRPEHMQAFEIVAEDQLVSDIQAALRREHDTVTNKIYDDYLRPMVISAVARARSHGIRLDTAITAFVVLMFEVAPNFDAHPAIGTYLREGDGTPDQRLFALRSAVPESVWEEAASMYDPAAWGRNA